jgi:hypothetical protein
MGTTQGIRRACSRGGGRPQYGRHGFGHFDRNQSGLTAGPKPGIFHIAAKFLGLRSQNLSHPLTSFSWASLFETRRHRIDRPRSSLPQGRQRYPPGPCSRTS